MAAALHAEWIVLHVASSRQRLSDSDREALTVNLRLAEQLGARPVTLTADDVVPEILAYARAQNVTRILVGKPTHSRWRDRVFGPLLDRLIRGSRDIDVYVITGEREDPRLAAVAPPDRPPAPTVAYLRTAAVVALAGIVGLGVRAWVNPTDIAMLFLLAVMVSAAWDGARPAVVASVLAIALFDFVFVLPYYTFAVADASYVLTFGVMLAVALSISRLTARIRGQAEAAREGAGLLRPGAGLGAVATLVEQLVGLAQVDHGLLLSAAGLGEQHLKGPLKGLGLGLAEARLLLRVGDRHGGKANTGARGARPETRLRLRTAVPLRAGDGAKPNATGRGGEGDASRDAQGHGAPHRLPLRGARVFACARRVPRYLPDALRRDGSRRRAYR